jgi:hypothetical protein
MHRKRITKEGRESSGKTKEKEVAKYEQRINKHTQTGDKKSCHRQMEATIQNKQALSPGNWENRALLSGVQ